MNTDVIKLPRTCIGLQELNGVSYSAHWRTWISVVPKMAYMFSYQTFLIIKQECIPVWCVSPALNRGVSLSRGKWGVSVQGGFCQGDPPPSSCEQNDTQV